MIRVLIADDEMLIRVGIKSILDSSDKYECIGGAANGKQALELAESEKPDIIITDIKMPEMDGIELIRGLKEKDCRSGIVILSNYNDFDLVREALKLGADDYLLKLQMTSDSLLKVLDEVCKKRNKDRGQILRQSKSVKLLLSDVLSQTFEMSESMEFFENQAEKGGALLTCLCLEICNPNSELSDHAVEDITENMWNELFAAWCTRIGEREYAIVVFGSYREKEGFMEALRCAGERYLNVLDDLLNITGRLYIGSVEEKPRRIPVSLQNALKLRFGEFREGKVLADYDSASARMENRGQETERAAREQWDRTYGAFRNAESQSRMPHAVRNAIEYMKEYYSRDLTLQEVADIVGLHPSYFSTLFNNTLNINFSNYLMCLRIRNAKRLLRETSMKIYEIADCVGYKNSYYFNRIFKKLTGITPTEYRDRL